jgi:hypothetical protein
VARRRFTRPSERRAEARSSGAPRTPGPRSPRVRPRPFRDGLLGASATMDQPAMVAVTQPLPPTLISRPATRASRPARIAVERERTPKPCLVVESRAERVQPYGCAGSTALGPADGPGRRGCGLRTGRVAIAGRPPSLTSCADSGGVMGSHALIGRACDHQPALTGEGGHRGMGHAPRSTARAAASAAVPPHEPPLDRAATRPRTPDRQG